MLPPWLQQYLPELVLWGTLLSVGTLLAIMVLVPLVLARLPANYFNQPRRHSLRERGGNAGSWLLTVLKNLLGAALVVLGLVMLFTPGQGLVTLLAGLLLMNFPGKYRLERRLGQGGFAEVWRARDTIERRAVALKVIVPRNAPAQLFKESAP